MNSLFNWRIFIYSFITFLFTVLWISTFTNEQNYKKQQVQIDRLSNIVELQAKNVEIINEYEKIFNEVIKSTSDILSNQTQSIISIRQMLEIQSMSSGSPISYEMQSSSNTNDVDAIKAMIKYIKEHPSQLVETMDEGFFKESK